MDKSRLCEIFFNNPLKLISIYKVSFTRFLKVATRLHVIKISPRYSIDLQRDINSIKFRYCSLEHFLYYISL